MIIKVYTKAGKTKLFIAKDSKELFKISTQYNRWEFV